LEEIRITAGEKLPVVHTQMFRVKNFNLHEQLDPKEEKIRLMYRPMPNVMGFSLYFKQLARGNVHFSIVENSHFKEAGSTWSEWWSDFNDRRDMSAYIKGRWLNNA